MPMPAIVHHLLMRLGDVESVWKSVDREAIGLCEFSRVVVGISCFGRS